MCSHYQPHIFHPSAMLVSGGDDINPRGIDAAVAEDVGEFGDIPFPVRKTCGRTGGANYAETPYWG